MLSERVVLAEMCFSSHVQPDLIGLHLELSGIGSLSDDIVEPIDEDACRVGDAGDFAQNQKGSGMSSTVSCSLAIAHKGNEIVSAKLIPRSTSNATAARLRNPRFSTACRCVT